MTLMKRDTKINFSTVSCELVYYPKEERQGVPRIGSKVLSAICLVSICVRKKFVYAHKLGHTHLKQLQKLADNNLSSHNPMETCVSFLVVCIAEDRCEVISFILNYISASGV